MIWRLFMNYDQSIENKLRILGILNGWIISYKKKKPFAFESEYNIPLERAELCVKDSISFIEKGVGIPERWVALVNKLKELYIKEYY